MKQIYLSFASAALLLAASCAGGIPPEDDCLETASRTRTVTVSLTVDSTFTQLCDAVYPSRSRTDGRLLRYKIWATDLTGRIVASAVTHEPEAVLTLPAGRCNVSAWADDTVRRQDNTQRSHAVAGATAAPGALHTQVPILLLGARQPRLGLLPCQRQKRPYHRPLRRVIIILNN